MPTEMTTLADSETMIPPDAGENVYDDGHLRVEHDNYYVSLDGRTLKLPRKEFLILSRLARNPDRIVPAEDIWLHAWGSRAPFNAESLHVHIYRLRQRLGPAGLRIETMINVGYRLMAPARGGNAASGHEG
ncbi:MAG: winged helix-turn-helix transcriptional regulator [Acidobacteria bacterium]|nr:winged helix-turn-helix transcriptional regulator [Acidobacteriota bacterium]